MLTTEIVIFNVFHGEKMQKAKKSLKKREICSKIQLKNSFFEFAPKRWWSVTSRFVNLPLVPPYDGFISRCGLSYRQKSCKNLSSVLFGICQGILSVTLFHCNRDLIWLKKLP